MSMRSVLRQTLAGVAACVSLAGASAAPLVPDLGSTGLTATSIVDQVKSSRKMRCYTKNQNCRWVGRGAGRTRICDTVEICHGGYSSRNRGKTVNS
jgi:hypothetical protein